MRPDHARQLPRRSSSLTGRKAPGIARSWRRLAVISVRVSWPFLSLSHLSKYSLTNELGLLASSRVSFPSLSLSKREKICETISGV